MKELHFDLLDKLYNPLRRLHIARHLKPNPANRNIPKKDNRELEKFLLSSQLPDANEHLANCRMSLRPGPPKIPPTCLMRLVTFNELPTLKPLKYKNFGSSISAKRSCLECILNN